MIIVVILLLSLYYCRFQASVRAILTAELVIFLCESTTMLCAVCMIWLLSWWYFVRKHHILGNLYVVHHISTRIICMLLLFCLCDISYVVSFDVQLTVRNALLGPLAPRSCCWRLCCLLGKARMYVRTCLSSVGMLVFLGAMCAGGVGRAERTA